jgi:hypothetical protein
MNSSSSNKNFALVFFLFAIKPTAFYSFEVSE